MAKNDFQYGGWDSYTLQCGTIRSWHCFRQVAAPCNVACDSGIVTVNSPSGSTFQCDTWLWDDMPLNSPGGSTLQCDTQLLNHDIEFTKWQHPAVWQVALGWHAIEFAQTSTILDILHLVSISTRSPQSTCHSTPVSEILSKSDHPRQKKMTSCRFSRWRISAILDFRDPIMGSLKSPIT